MICTLIFFVVCSDTASVETNFILISFPTFQLFLLRSLVFLLPMLSHSGYCRKFSLDQRCFSNPFFPCKYLKIQLIIRRLAFWTAKCFLIFVVDLIWLYQQPFEIFLIKLPYFKKKYARKCKISLREIEKTILINATKT